MANSLTALIEAWFREHEGDGEYLSSVRSLPYSVIGSSGDARCVIFTTKPTIVSAAFYEYEPPERCGMIGRYGLPNKADLVWIRKVIGRDSLFFLGDMDPVDLMVFAWLRAGLRPKHVTHLGINDVLLKALRLRQIKSLFSLCAPSERESIPLLREVLPDLGETVGPKCAQMLERGDKLELDVIVGNRERAAATLRSLLSSTYSQRKKEEER